MGAEGEPSLEYPKLRSVEAVAAGDDRICLRDPQGFSDKLIFLPPQAFFIVSLFDGRRSLLDIQAEYTRRFGDLLFSAELRQLIGQLDAALFLESPRFAQARSEAVAAFAASPVRNAWHAGLSYERDPDKLRGQLEALFGGREAGPIERRGRLVGLIAPHIDLRRGAPGYAAGYAELAQRGTARTFLILGVSHIETRRRFALSAKDFETPLGTVPVDRDFMARVSALCRTDFFEDEFAHRSEHSVEFQVLLLRYIHAQRSDVRIVPVLCTSLPQTQSGEPPEANAEAEEFLGALRTAVEERGDEVCLIAGVDLSHVGRRFGQDLSLSPSLLRELELQDRAMIQRILDRDPSGFFRGIQEEKDRRNVCGVPAIYALLRLLPPSGARLLAYGQAPDPQTQSVVTFMSAAFYNTLGAP